MHAYKHIFRCMLLIKQKCSCQRQGSTICSPRNKSMWRGPILNLCPSPEPQAMSCSCACCSPSLIRYSERNPRSPCNDIAQLGRCEIPRQRALLMLGCQRQTPRSEDTKCTDGTFRGQRWTNVTRHPKAFPEPPEPSPASPTRCKRVTQHFNCLTTNYP